MAIYRQQELQLGWSPVSAAAVESDAAVEVEEKMAIVQEWLTSLPTFAPFSPGRVLAAAGLQSPATPMATPRGRTPAAGKRPPTAVYARRNEPGKSSSALVRLSSSKRRTSATASRSGAFPRGSSQKQRLLQQPQQQARVGFFLPAGDSGVRAPRQPRVHGDIPRLSLPNMSEPETVQPQPHLYSQTARPPTSAAAPRWLQGAAAWRLRQQRSRSLETGLAATDSSDSPRTGAALRPAWGSASNLLAAQSSSSLDVASRTFSRPRYERVASPKPLHETREEARTARQYAAASSSLRAATRRPATTTAQLTPGGANSVDSLSSTAPAGAEEAPPGHLVAEVPTGAQLAQTLEAGDSGDSLWTPRELAQQQLPTPPPPPPPLQQQQQQQQQASMRLLREIGQRRPKPAFGAAEETGADPTPTGIALSAASYSKDAAEKPAFQSQFGAQWPQPPQPSWRVAAPAHSISGAENNFRSTHGEPETAVGYFTERERFKTAAVASTASHQTHTKTLQLLQSASASSCALGTEAQGPASVTGQPFLHNQALQQQASTRSQAQVFQLLPTSVGSQNHSQAAAPSAVRRTEKRPVSYGYDWLQEFNKMSLTEAEIEKRVKNGGRLRNSASQSTRFELPFDLTDLEGMDPKDYLRQYTVVSSRRLYLYQKVFQKYRNSSLNAVETKDLPRCIADIIVGGISEDKLDEVLELVSLGSAGPLDAKLFYAFCAVVERQTTGKKQPDDPSEVMESHKQRLECADFIGLNYKFKGINLSDKMIRLLRAL